MRRVTRPERLNLRIPEATSRRIGEYAQTMGVTHTEAVRVLVEDRLRELKLGGGDREHIYRLLEIGEYLFSSMIAQNEVSLSPERRQQVVDETAKALSEKYTIEDETD
jgi:hypothetical protein